MITIPKPKGKFPVEGTVKDWGPSPPSLPEVVGWYQKLFNVELASSAPSLVPTKVEDGREEGI